MSIPAPKADVGRSCWQVRCGPIAEARSAHRLVGGDKTRHVYDREKRAQSQTLQGNRKPEEQRALTSRQYRAEAQLYLHRSKAVEQPERHQRERDHHDK
jgi:hypothetical protein